MLSFRFQDDTSLNVSSTLIDEAEKAEEKNDVETDTGGNGEFCEVADGVEEGICGYSSEVFVYMVYSYLQT